MPGGLGRRFLIEAGFLIAVAIVAGVARLGALTIILVMAGAWLLMAAVEWAIARARAQPAVEGPPVEAVAAVEPAPAFRLSPEPAAERRDPEPEPAPDPEPATTPGPSPDPTPEPEPEAPPEPAPEPAPPTQPRVAVVAAVPEPPPVRAPEPEPQPRVIPFTARGLGVPQRWNLWELERIARDSSGADAIRDEERSFLLMYLREFAEADGVLPTSFDAVVREAFGDVLDAVGA